MRVLLWIGQYWPYVGGVEILAAQAVSLLRSHGYEFAVVTSHGQLDLPDEDFHDGIPIYRFPFRRALAERQIELLAKAKNGVVKLKKSFQPELVHVYFTDPSVFFHLQTAEASPAPTLISVHVGLPSVAKKGSLLDKTLDTSQWVTTTSEAMLTQARQLFPDITSHSSFIYNGVKSPCVPVKPPPRDTHTILCLGRLVRDKGFDVALSAFEMLSKQFPRARLIIAGEGVARGPLEEQSRRLGISARVTFTGLIEHADIGDLLNEANVVVVPSRWEEAFGLVAVEAAFMERPVVASRVGGLPEVVVDGTTGILVEREDVNGLASAIVRLLENPEEAAELGRAARERGKRIFSLERHVRSYDHLYRTLINEYSHRTADA